MRTEMLPIKNALEEIRYKGTLATYGFTVDEAIEYAEEQNDLHDKDLKREWLDSIGNTKQMFLDDKVISEEEANELRRKALFNDFEKATRDYHAKRVRGEATRADEGKKNRALFNYQISTYYPSESPLVSKQEIEQAMRRNVGEFIKLNKGGFAPCPFHKEHTPSFHAERNKYYCFGCGDGGTIVSFIMKIRSMTFPQAVRYLI
jgi:hypothetical protein